MLVSSESLKDTVVKAKQLSSPPGFCRRHSTEQRGRGAMEEEEGMRARSFRMEDYNNRRAFLRSYPLQWEDTDIEGDRAEGDQGDGTRGSKGKLADLKHRVVVAVFRWGGGQVLLLRKLKNKVAFYLFACQPFGFKPSTTQLLAA